MEKWSYHSDRYKGWTTEGPNILADPTLERIRQALSEGWICGIHMYLGGGGSPDPVAFSTYNAFHSHVTESRTGDCFVLWSLADMRKKGLLLVDSYCDEAALMRSSLLSREDLDHVRGYLAEGELHEIFSVASADGKELVANWTDLSGSNWDRFIDSSKRTAVPGGAICVLPLTKIDVPELYLVKARRPNLKGKVPLGGAY